MPTDTAATSLLTLAEYKVFEGIDSSAQANDPHLITFIDAASEKIENYCQRKFVGLSAIDDVFWGNNACKYFPDEVYIRDGSTPSLYYWNGSAWVQMSAPTYLWEVHRLRKKIEFTDGNLFSETIRYKLTYTYGWTKATVPKPIKEACGKLVLRTKKLIDKQQEGLNSESAGESATSYNLADWTNEILRMLAPYMKVTV